MSSEVPVTPEPAAEPPKEATPAAQAEAGQAKPEPVTQPEPDWRAAYVGLQRTVNKSHQRNEALTQQNVALVDTIGSLKGDLDTLLKRSMPEEEFKALETQRTQQQERAAAMAAAGNLQGFVVAQTGIFLDVLRASGIDPNDPTIDWARDAGNVTEWRERVGPSITARIQRASAERVQQHEATLKAKTAKEVEAEGRALAERELKARGVDKIDTAKGGRSTGSFVEKLRSLDRNTPEGEAEYQRIRKDVHRGTLAV